jgi:hypothetical protein
MSWLVQTTSSTGTNGFSAHRIQVSQLGADIVKKQRAVEMMEI